jgi:hypothetical protein
MYTNFHISVWNVKKVLSGHLKYTFLNTDHKFEIKSNLNECIIKIPFFPAGKKSGEILWNPYTSDAQTRRKKLRVATDCDYCVFPTSCCQAKMAETSFPAASPLVLRTALQPTRRQERKITTLIGDTSYC